MAYLLWKTAWQFLRRFKIEPPWSPTIPFLGTYPKESKVGLWKDIHTPMFNTRLLTTAERDKEPKQP